MKPLRVLCIGLVLIYPSAAHVSATIGRPGWGVACMLALVGAVLRLALPSWRAWLVGFAAVLSVALLAPPQGLLYLPPVLLNVALAIVFGATLRPGAEPFIGRIARLERGESLDSRLAAYSRRLTQVWTVFFVVMGVASAALAFAPVHIWSLFTNGLAYVLIAALFLGEWLYRRVRLSEYRHAPPWALVRIVARAGLSARVGSA